MHTDLLSKPIEATIQYTTTDFINKLIFIGLEQPSAQSIDHDIPWLACAFQCILISKIRYQLLVMLTVVAQMSTHAFCINWI